MPYEFRHFPAPITRARPTMEPPTMTNDEWVKERAELAVSNAECGAQLEVEDEELRASFIRNIVPALQDAIERGKESGAVEWNLAYAEGFERGKAEQDKAVAAGYRKGWKRCHAIFLRLENPDEAMVEAAADEIMGVELEGRIEMAREIIRALATILAGQENTDG